MTSVQQNGPVVGKTPPPHIAEVVRSAEQQLTGLLRQRREIMRRIGTIKQMLSGMADLYGNAILPEELLCLIDRGSPMRRKGFTRACRQLLRESPVPLRSRQASAELRRRFPELAQHHKDLVASVATIFHRLVEYGEACSCLDKEGVRVWEWSSERAPEEETSAPDTVKTAPIGLAPDRFHGDARNDLGPTRF
jgi:hypothetical protein